MKANQIWMYKIFKDSLLLIGQYFNETPSRHLSYFPWGRMARRAQLDSLKMWHLRANFLTKLLQNDCYKSCFSTYRSSLTEVFCKKGALGNFAKFTGKHLCHSLFFNKFAELRPEAYNFIKKRDQNTDVVAKFLRTLFLTEHIWWLLVNLFLLNLSFRVFDVFRLDLTEKFGKMG